MSRRSNPIRRITGRSDDGEAASRRKPARIECPECGEQFRPRPATKRKVKCPACEATVRVPRRREGLVGLPADVGRNFFVGVFTFPLYQGVFSRWLLLSVGCVLTSLTTAMVIWFANAGWVGAVWALRMTWGWTTIFTLSYACSLGLQIVTETSAGSEVVEGWPDPDWREWVIDLFRVALPALIVGVAALMLAGPLSLLFDVFWPQFLALVFLIFPLVFMSSMHAGSAGVPLTITVLMSVATHWWAWLSFYAAAAVLASVWPGLLILGFTYQPIAVSALTGPFMAAALLVYARLLGRLGHSISKIEDA